MYTCLTYYLTTTDGTPEQQTKKIRTGKKSTTQKVREAVNGANSDTKATTKTYTTTTHTTTIAPINQGNNASFEYGFFIEVGNEGDEF